MRKRPLYALCHISTDIPILNWRRGEREREADVSSLANVTVPKGEHYP